MLDLQKVKIGDLLVNAGVITEAQLSQAINVQKSTGDKLGKVLVNLGFATNEQIGNLLGEQHGREYLDPLELEMDTKVFNLFPEPFMKKHSAVAVRLENDRLHVAMINPNDMAAIEEMRLLTGYRIKPFVATSDSLQALMSQGGKLEERVGKTLDEIDVAFGKAEDDEGNFDEDVGEDNLEDAPIVKLVNQILFEAIRQECTDVHVEPARRDSRVRFRIDGLLRDIMNVPKKVQGAVISRIKILADLDISEKRAPQDGRFSTQMEGKSYDVRVSTMPTNYGEKCVMRILDQGKAMMGLSQLGLDQHDYDVLMKMVTRPYGVVLVTGPTGSGKTTTLYSIIHEINKPDININTIEDPIEYKLDGVNQTQVHERAGVTFATGLRALLRQDPDIILVGEIRDQETVNMVLNASMTGHLVFGTLHTNDAPTAVARMLELGASPFILASTLNGVIAQRLIRKVCTHCKSTYQPTIEELNELRKVESDEFMNLSVGGGCKVCNQSGYKGRTAAMEIMTVTGRISDIIMERTSSRHLRNLAREEGMRTLYEAGLTKVVKGMTTYKELARVVPSEDD